MLFNGCFFWRCHPWVERSGEKILPLPIALFVSSSELLDGVNSLDAILVRRKHTAQLPSQ